MKVSISTRDRDDINLIFAILVILVASAVVMLETMADIIRMDALAIDAFEEGNHEHLTVMVVDVDIETNDGSKIAAKQKEAGNRLYETAEFHFGGEFTKNIAIFAYPKRKIPTHYDTINDRIRQRNCRT